MLTAPTDITRSRPARSWFSRHRTRTQQQQHQQTVLAPAAAPVDLSRLTAIAEEAVASFRSQAIGRRCHTGVDEGTRVRVVVSSAAVTSDPSRLEIWVLLGDVAEERVPPRWDPTEVEADPDLTRRACALRNTAIGHLASLDWPFADQVTVRFDVAERVERRGGWRYVAA